MCSAPAHAEYRVTDLARRGTSMSTCSGFVETERDDDALYLRGLRSASTTA